MIRLVGMELLKTFLKWRTFIGFIAILVVVPLVEFGLKSEGANIVRNMTRGLSAEFLFVGNLFNGYFITYFIMNSLWVHVPFLISLVAGDQIAGEATAGTTRLLLTRPPSRSKILFAKYVTTTIYTAALVAFLGILSAGLGIALFGRGDLLVTGKTIVILESADVPWRLIVAFGFAAWSMWCVASLAFLFSSLVENPIGPIIATMAVLIVSIVVTNVPVAIFEAVKPYLFTTYMNVWQLVMDDPVPWSEIGTSLAVLTAYGVGFYLTTWYIFVRKDVLS